MITANEAKKMVIQHEQEKAKRLNETALAWVEQNANRDIEKAATKGETSVTYRLTTQLFNGEYLNAILDIIKDAGYEVDTIDGQGCVIVTIDW